MLVRALVREAGTDEVQRWLAAQDPAACTIGDWVLTEFASALSLKMRAGTLREIDPAVAWDAMSRLAAESFTLLAVERRHFRSAADLAARFQLGLRSGDAPHLAIASATSRCLVTFDAKLDAAARSIGVAVQVP